jgi:hypothetical protein
VSEDAREGAAAQPAEWERLWGEGREIMEWLAEHESEPGSADLIVLKRIRILEILSRLCKILPGGDPGSFDEFLGSLVREMEKSFKKIVDRELEALGELGLSDNDGKE